MGRRRPARSNEALPGRGIWQNGHEDRHAEAVKQMKPGDRIAIKALGAQRQGLPFDSHGHTVSRMAIKARGTILRNRDDGRTVEVEWEPKGPPVDWLPACAGTAARAMPELVTACGRKMHAGARADRSALDAGRAYAMLCSPENSWKIVGGA